MSLSSSQRPPPPHSRRPPPDGDPRRNRRNGTDRYSATPEVMSNLLASFPAISSDTDSVRQQLHSPDQPSSPFYPTPSDPWQASSGLSPPQSPLADPYDLSAPDTLPSEATDNRARATPAPNGDTAEPPVVKTSRRPPPLHSSYASSRPRRQERNGDQFLSSQRSPLMSPMQAPSRGNQSPVSNVHPGTGRPRGSARDRTAGESTRSYTKRDSILLAHVREGKGKERERNPSMTATSIEIHAPPNRPPPPKQRTKPSAIKTFSPAPSIYEDDSGLVMSGPSFAPQSPREDSSMPTSPMKSSAVPTRGSSLKQSDKHSKPSSRRSSRSRKGDVTASPGPSERFPSKLQQTRQDFGLDEDNDVVKRINQLRAAKEERKKTQADEELTDALESTIANSQRSQAFFAPPQNSYNTSERALPRPWEDMAMNSYTLRENSETFLASPRSPEVLPRTMKSSSRRNSILKNPMASSSGALSRPGSSGRQQKRLSFLTPTDGDGSRQDILQSSASSLRREPTNGDPSYQLGESVGASVDRFLGSRKLSQRLTIAHEGRTVAFSEVGNPEGFAVICCVGMGLTRFVTAFYDELATSLHLRLVTLDRPGIGDSEAYGGDYAGGPMQWPDDILAVCSHLSIRSFSILAHSVGAMYALATALRLTSHVEGKIHLLAPWIPPSQMATAALSKGNSPYKTPTASVPRSHRFLRMIPTPLLKLTNSSFMGSMAGGGPSRPSSRSHWSGDSAAPSAFTSAFPSAMPSAMPSATPSAAPSIHASPRPSISRRRLPDLPLGKKSTDQVTEPALSPRLDDWVSVPSDHGFTAAVLQAGRPSTPRGGSIEEQEMRRREYDAALTPAVWDLTTRNSNPASDLIVAFERNQPIGFQYTDIRQRVVIHHGTKDHRVPVQNAKWLSNVMQNAELDVIEGEGHGLMASAAVVSRVLTDISRERNEIAKDVIQEEDEDSFVPTLDQRGLENFDFDLPSFHRG